MKYAPSSGTRYNGNVSLYYKISYSALMEIRIENVLTLFYKRFPYLKRYGPP